MAAAGIRERARRERWGTWGSGWDFFLFFFMALVLALAFLAAFSSYLLSQKADPA